MMRFCCLSYRDTMDFLMFVSISNEKEKMELVCKACLSPWMWGLGVVRSPRLLATSPPLHCSRRCCIGSIHPQSAASIYSISMRAAPECAAVLLASAPRFSSSSSPSPSSDLNRKIPEEQIHWKGETLCRREETLPTACVFTEVIHYFIQFFL